MTTYPTAHDLNKRTAAGEAGANYVHPGDAPDPIYRETLPELGKLYAAYEAKQAEALAVAHERRAWIERKNAALGGKRSTDEIDAALAEKFRAEGARLDARQRTASFDALVALRAYDRAAVEAMIDGTLKPKAARLALEAHDDAVAAYAALVDALARRERFYAAAGAPQKERTWQSRTPFSGNADGRRRQMDEALAALVETFPAGAVEQITKAAK